MSSSSPSYELPHNFKNPLTHLWGFHLHNDVPEVNLPDSLLIQRELIDFMLKQNAPVVRDEAYWPGYGPHRECMWEIRIELPVHADIATKKMELRENGAKEADINPNDPAFLKSNDGKYDFVANAKRLLPLVGISALWMLENKNQRALGGYLHYIDHDESLPLLPMMSQETTEHNNILFFSHTKSIDMNFFTNPPLEADGNLVDTRTSRIMSKKDREDIIAKAPQQSKDLVFASRFVPKGVPSEQSSETALFAKTGYRIFVNFSGRSKEQRTLGFELYETLLQWLQDNSTSKISSSSSTNEEHDQNNNNNNNNLLPDEKWIEHSETKFHAGFCLTFNLRNGNDSLDLCTRIGYTLMFLMMNHGSLEVTMVPVGYPSKAVVVDAPTNKNNKEEEENKETEGVVVAPPRNETTILGLGGTPVCFVDRPPQPFSRVIRF